MRMFPSFKLSCGAFTVRGCLCLKRLMSHLKKVCHCNCWEYMCIIISRIALNVFRDVNNNINWYLHWYICILKYIFVQFRVGLLIIVKTESVWTLVWKKIFINSDFFFSDPLKKFFQNKNKFLNELLFFLQHGNATFFPAEREQWRSSTETSPLVIWMSHASFQSRLRGMEIRKFPHTPAASFKCEAHWSKLTTIIKSAKCLNLGDTFGHINHESIWMIQLFIKQNGSFPTLTKFRNFPSLTYSSTL